jgi:uncharacterized protein YraI
MRDSTRTRTGLGGTSRLLASALALLLTALLASGPSIALAQADALAPGTVVRVANTDGQRLNVRAGPSTNQPIVARLLPDETLTVTGASQTVGAERWLPVRTVSGQNGWVSAQYVVVVAPATSAAPAANRAADPAPAPVVSTPAAGSASPARNDRDERKGKPVQVEAKLKFPEVKGREQEITVFVTRDGAPVLGATVTLETNDGDENDRFRQLDPTDNEGRTRRVFDVRHEKGTVELQVEAVAPDGGEGRTIVSYFRR